MFYMKTANINVRIEDWIYQKLKQLNINISETIRVALISEIEKTRIEDILKELDTSSKAVKKMGVNSIVSEIRSSRDTR